jgi:hypothetical protein
MIYGGNEAFVMQGAFDKENPYFSYDVSVKRPDGSWDIDFTDDLWGNPISVAPSDVFGDILCRPSPADYDGDGVDDRAVQCSNIWKIAFSTQPGTLSEVELDQAIDPLPAYAYTGGIKYQDQLDLFNYYKTKLPCDNNQKCTAGSTISNVVPPIGPYFAECVKYWAPNATYCWNK